MSVPFANVRVVAATYSSHTCQQAHYLPRNCDCVLADRYSVKENPLTKHVQQCVERVETRLRVIFALNALWSGGWGALALLASDRLHRTVLLPAAELSRIGACLVGFVVLLLGLAATRRTGAV